LNKYVQQEDLMWYCLHKKLTEVPLSIRLVFLSVGGHLAVLFFMGMVVQLQVRTHHINIQKRTIKPSTFVYVPLIKRTNMMVSTTGTSSKNSPPSGTRNSSCVKAIPKAVSAPAPKKVTTSLKKTATLPKVLPQKSAVTVSSLKGKKQETKELKVEEKKKVILPQKEGAPPKDHTLTRNDKKNSSLPIPLNPEEVPVVVLGREDLKEMQLVEQVYELLHSSWKVPKGLSSNLSCDIQFFVDGKGTVGQLKVVRSSGIILFDIAARNAVSSSTFKTNMYGQQFCITFCS
jgi:outer membrane biosynthesis protein TonB